MHRPPLEANRPSANLLIRHKTGNVYYDLLVSFLLQFQRSEPFWPNLLPSFTLLSSITNTPSDSPYARPNDKSQITDDRFECGHRLLTAYDLSSAICHLPSV